MEIEDDQAPGPKLERIGIQLFSLPNLLEKDFAGTVKLLAEMGYRELELFGPYPFSHPAAREAWAAITPMLGFSGSGYFGLDAKTVKSIMDDHGMKAPSAHTDLETLSQRMEQLGEAARILGHQYVTLPAIPAEERQSLDDYRRMADRFNAIGEKAREQGIKFAYHNHGYGWQEQDGVMPIELIFQHTDPQLVFFELDIFWTTAAGADPIYLLKRFPQRYHLLHLKDMQPKARFSGDGSDPAQWMALYPNMTTTGSGKLEVRDIVHTALRTGVRHFFVEQDLVAEPETALAESIRFLRSV